MAFMPIFNLTNKYSHPTFSFFYTNIYGLNINKYQILFLKIIINRNLILMCKILRLQRLKNGQYEMKFSQVSEF